MLAAFAKSWVACGQTAAEGQKHKKSTVQTLGQFSGGATKHPYGPWGKFGRSRNHPYFSLEQFWAALGQVWAVEKSSVFFLGTILGGPGAGLGGREIVRMGIGAANKSSER